MEYKKLSNRELIEKLVNLNYYDAALCTEICDRAGLTWRWSRADGVGCYGSRFSTDARGGSGFYSVLYLAVQRLNSL